MDWKTAVRIIAKVGYSSALPKSGYVKLGYSCNNHCLFCTAEWKKRHGDRDTATILEEISRIVLEEKVDRLVYSGGEPTIRGDLPQIIAYARRMGVRQQVIQTNARRLRELAYVQALQQAGVTSCFVSVHGCDASTHDGLTRRPGSFRQTCAGMDNLQRLGVSFSTNTVVCKQNLQSLKQLVTFLRSNFPALTKAKLSYPNLQGGAMDNLFQVVAPLWEVASSIRDAIEWGTDEELSVDTEFVPLCLIGMYYDRASELTPVRYHVSDVTFRIPNWDHRCRSQDHVYYLACDACDLRLYCCGIHPLHHEAFGENACFQAVSFSTMEG